MQIDLMEYMVYQKRTTKAKALMMFFFILTSLCAASMVVTRSIGLAFTVLLAWITYKFIYPLGSIEYEYLYCDKMITVDMIKAEKKRKTLAEYSLDRMELMCPLNSDRWKAYEHKNFKVYEYWSHMESDKHKPYAFIYGGNQKIVLDLPEEFVKIVQNNAPRKVYFD